MPRGTRPHADLAAGLPVSPVLQLDDPIAGGGAGDQFELVGVGDAVEQPGALARNVGEQAQLELVDQVEPHERPPEADAAPDDDVAVAALPELVDLFDRVTSGDGGVGPIGRLQGPGEDDLARGVQDVGERVVGGRCCHGPGDGLVGGAAHDVRVRAAEKVELLRVVGLTVFGQAEAELPKLGALVGEKAVDRVVEHCRYELPHDRNSLSSRDQVPGSRAFVRPFAVRRQYDAARVTCPSSSPTPIATTKPRLRRSTNASRTASGASPRCAAICSYASE